MSKINKKSTRKKATPLYRTKQGECYVGRFEDIYEKLGVESKVQLIITSPPFPLNKKKRYGNKQGDDYLEWIGSLANKMESLLTDDGSIVIEIGNAWEKKRPVQSLLTLKALEAIVSQKDSGLRLIQEFICENPARLPSPAQWVTINRIRAVDSFTHVWWIAKNDYPKADNTRILRPYSKSMEKLVNKEEYNAGMRPSQHLISEKGFLNPNTGSISHNYLDLGDDNNRVPFNCQRHANTRSNDFYTRKCKEKGIQPHPARMQPELASFFISFLTDKNDIVLDPFAGSNTSGMCAERLGRKWISIECDETYAINSATRFEDPSLNTYIRKSKQFKKLH